MKDFFRSFGYACKGILEGFHSERNFKIQLSIATITVGAGFYFHISSTDWCIILLCIALVLTAELINTSIEKLVDLTTRERVPLAGKIKDMAAGAVLIISTVSLIVAIVIFTKYLRLPKPLHQFNFLSTCFRPKG